ncbi:MAG: VWA domain-containing protein [Acidobacteriaceae bacterium]|nr:VWA domain-containing protein [Acidobacteriaceae bacterium]
MKPGIVLFFCAIFVPAALAQAPVVRRPPTKILVPDEDSPQQQPAPQSSVPTLHVQTRLVNVPVNVVDEHGAPVNGLHNEDFELLEDGKPQTVSYFEKESSTPLSIVLAIDASESVLRDERLEKMAAKKFIEALLREQDELALMEFSDTVREITSFTNQIRQIEAGLNNLRHGDETALFDAVYLASDQLATTKNDAGRRRVLVLITDGEDTRHKTRYGQALEQAQRAGAMIYSIIIVPIAADAGRSVGGEHALIQLSNDTGGKFYYVVDRTDLEPAFAHVSDDLRTQYVLGYYAPQGARDSFRRITVRLKNPELRDKYQIRSRSGYYADSR